MKQTVSYWKATYELPKLPPLETNLDADCVIVGSGISGLTCAYLLLKSGKSVVVLDDSEVAGGQTERTTGHLTYFLDDRLFELENLFGVEGLKKGLLAHKQALELIEKIASDENIDCDFEKVDAHLFYDPSQDVEILNREFDAAERTGLKGFSFQKSPFPFFESPYCITLKGQAEFHPLKYLHGLLLAIFKMGGKVYSKAHVVEVQGGDSPYVKTDQGFQVTGKTIVIATNTPINNRFIMHTKQAAYRTYVIGSYVPQGTIPKGLYYDTLDPYHYVRVVSEHDRDLLMIGGEDHKTGQNNHPHACFERLESWTKAHFPMIQKIDYSWSGQIMEPVDSLGFAGKNPLEKNVYIVTGDSGNGLTHGTLGAKITSDLILGKPSPESSLFDPSRKTLSSIDTFAEENLNVGVQYAEWLRPEPITEASEIKKNSGAIIQKGLEKLAVYKDEKGDLYEYSALCPHLGCVVNWNDVEKTWDCPCHGSRFECKGKVIDGPACSNLKKKARIMH